MDLIKGWVDVIYGPSLGRKRRSLERSQANLAIQRAQNRLQTHIEETQRSGALLGQALAARGLGESTIATQERERFYRLAERQRGELEKDLHIARKYKKYLRRRHRYERLSFYAGLLDQSIETILVARKVFGGGGEGDIGGGGGGGAMTGASVYMGG